MDSEVSLINIESVNESIAYCISKPELEALFSHSIDMANFGRRIFEREILSVDSSTVAYGTPPTAKERYMTLMEEIRNCCRMYRSSIWLLISTSLRNP